MDFHINNILHPYNPYNLIEEMQSTIPTGCYSTISFQGKVVIAGAYSHKIQVEDPQCWPKRLMNNKIIVRLASVSSLRPSYIKCMQYFKTLLSCTSTRPHKSKTV